MYHAHGISCFTNIVFHVSCTPHTTNIIIQLRISLTPLTELLSSPPPPSDSYFEVKSEIKIG